MPVRPRGRPRRCTRRRPGPRRTRTARRSRRRPARSGFSNMSVIWLLHVAPRIVPGRKTSWRSSGCSRAVAGQHLLDLALVVASRRTRGCRAGRRPRASGTRVVGVVAVGRAAAGVDELRHAGGEAGSQHVPVPSTSTEYSSSRGCPPGVTIAARCTTVSTAWRAGASTRPGSRMSPVAVHDAVDAARPRAARARRARRCVATRRGPRPGQRPPGGRRSPHAPVTSTERPGSAARRRSADRPHPPAPGACP